MVDFDIAKVRISKHTRVISNGDQHVLFNPNSHTWVRISNSLWEIVQKLEGRPFDEAIKDMSCAHAVPKESLRESVRGLIAMRLLEKTKGWNGEDRAPQCFQR